VLIIVNGVPGSGKSYFIKNKLRKIFENAFYISWDDLKAPFIDDRDRSDKNYQQVIKPALQKIENNLITRNIYHHIIIEGTYWDKVQNPNWIENYFYYIDKSLQIRCIASEETIKQRLGSRGYKRDDNKIKDEKSWQAFLIKEPIKITGFKGLEMNTDKEQNIKDIREMILDYLRRNNG